MVNYLPIYLKATCVSFLLTVCSYPCPFNILFLNQCLITKMLFFYVHLVKTWVRDRRPCTPNHTATLSELTAAEEGSLYALPSTPHPSHRSPCTLLGSSGLLQLCLLQGSSYPHLSFPVPTLSHTLRSASSDLQLVSLQGWPDPCPGA